jgi:hypothetical protein
MAASLHRKRVTVQLTPLVGRSRRIWLHTVHSRGTGEYVGFTIRLHHRLVCQEPTGEAQSQAGATPFDG